MKLEPWFGFTERNKEQLIQMKFLSIEERLKGGRAPSKVQEEEKAEEEVPRGGRKELSS